MWIVNGTNKLKEMDRDAKIAQIAEGHHRRVVQRVHSSSLSLVDVMLAFRKLFLVGMLGIAVFLACFLLYDAMNSGGAVFSQGQTVVDDALGDAAAAVVDAVVAAETRRLQEAVTTHQHCVPYKGRSPLTGNLIDLVRCYTHTH